MSWIKETNGSSTSVNVSGRSYALFTLRGGNIIAKKNHDNSVSYYFPNLDSDRYRRMFIWNGGGSVSGYIDIPDGTLQMDDALVFDISTKTLTVKHGSWGNVSLSVNEYLLLYNNLGIITGLLSKYVVDGDNHEKEVIITPTNYTAIPISISTIQSFCFVGNELWCFDKDINTSSLYRYDSTSFTQIGSAISHSLGYWNSADYNNDLDCIVTGNGTGQEDYTDIKATVYYDVSTWTSLASLDTTTVKYIDIDLNGLNLTGNNDFKVQACWGDSNFGENNIIYIVTNDGANIRKLMLGKGANNLGNGTFSTVSDNEFNGTYKILNKWSQPDGGGHVQDMVYHNGAIYSNSKNSITEGGLIVWKHELGANDGMIQKKKIFIPVYDNTTGNLATVESGEGLTIKDDKIYCTLINHSYFIIDVPI